MKVSKVINNNVISVYNSKGEESILTGKGIGFQKKPGDEIAEAQIEKVFRLTTNEKTASLRELLRETPLEVVEIAEYAIEQAKNTYQKVLNDFVYVTLTDHLHFAIERAQKGLFIRNDLLWDIRKLYQDEYRIGVEVIKLTKERIGVDLPEDEAGFIALHLVNSELNEQVNTTKSITTLIQEILTIVKYHTTKEWDEESLHYSRFVTHLKFFAQRLFSGCSLEGDENLDIYHAFQKKPIYACTRKIEDFLMKTYHYQLSNEEKLYLTIHIERSTK